MAPWTHSVGVIVGVDSRKFKGNFAGPAIFARSVAAYYPARMQFFLDSRLAADTLFLGDMLQSRVLLMNDARFPWLILVPRRPNLRELLDLAATERAILMEEIAQTSAALRDATQADKLNVAALGNMVPQLHIHVIARFAGDPAWPGPVWGRGQAAPYEAEAARRFGAGICRRLGFV